MVEHDGIVSEVRVEQHVFIAQKRRVFGNIGNQMVQKLELPYTFNIGDVPLLNKLYSNFQQLQVYKIKIKELNGHKLFIFRN